MQLLANSAGITTNTRATNYCDSCVEFYEESYPPGHIYRNCIFVTVDKEFRIHSGFWWGFKLWLVSWKGGPKLLETQIFLLEASNRGEFADYNTKKNFWNPSIFGGYLLPLTYGIFDIKYQIPWVLWSYNQRYIYTRCNF